MKAVSVFFLAALASVALAIPTDARERVHYIAADSVLWNYAPQQRDLIASRPLRPLEPGQLGWIYKKAIYREYTDGSFRVLLPRSTQNRYLGLVGPVIHAEVGDTVVVVFRNRTSAPVNIAPAGLRSDPPARPVKPGDTKSFRWPIGLAEGPGSHDTSSLLYTYESNVKQSSDENAGLIGPLIVTRRGAAGDDGAPRDVDREIVTLFSTQAEPLSFLLDANISDSATNPKHISKGLATLPFRNLFATINGYVFGNMPMPLMRSGEHVRWYLLSTQNNVDGHAPTWDGATVLFQGNRSDTVPLVSPHLVVDMIPDDPGTWLLHCALNVHFAEGMAVRYRVLPLTGRRISYRQTREPPHHPSCCWSRSRR